MRASAVGLVAPRGWLTSRRRLAGPRLDNAIVHWQRRDRGVVAMTHDARMLGGGRSQVRMHSEAR